MKCGCQVGCKEGRCSCAKNGLNCTPLCKCYSDGCSYFSSKTAEVSNVDDNADDNDIEDETDLLFG